MQPPQLVKIERQQPVLPDTQTLRDLCSRAFSQTAHGVRRELRRLLPPAYFFGRQLSSPTTGLFHPIEGNVQPVIETIPFGAELSVPAVALDTHAVQSLALPRVKRSAFQMARRVLSPVCDRFSRLGGTSSTTCSAPRQCELRELRQRGQFAKEEMNEIAALQSRHHIARSLVTCCRESVSRGRGSCG